jgi:hypothetical protein
MEISASSISGWGRAVETRARLACAGLRNVPIPLVELAETRVD